MQEYSLSTERLTLRSILFSDANAWYDIIHAYPGICEYMTWSPPKSVAAVQTNIQKTRSSEDIQLAICIDKTFIGIVTIRNFHWWQQESSKGSAFLSFWISPEYGGKGYGTEMLKEVCRFGFEDLRLRKIFAGTFSQNIPSQKLLQKVGFNPIGTLREHYLKDEKLFDSVRYELLFETLLPETIMADEEIIQTQRELRPYLPASFPSIETDLLTLQKVEIADAQSFLTLITDHPTISTYMTWNPPIDIADAEYKCVYMRRDGDINIALRNTTTGQIIGKATLRNFRFTQQEAIKNSAFFSFWLIPEYNTPKYAQELLKTISHYGFKTLGLRKIIAGIFSENDITKEQLETFGFVLIGRLQKHYVKNNTEYDSLRYELISSDLSSPQ